MSHFYGIISESARKNAPTARGHYSLRVEAQSWQGKIVTRLDVKKTEIILMFGENRITAQGVIVCF
jgi:hypothetical protein